MQRRQFLICNIAFLGGFHNRKFVFKIKTKNGGIIGGITIEAKDIEAAKYKLKQRYPDCEILEAKEK
jgi:hypothetical protein